MREVPTHSFTPAQLMKVLMKYFYAGEALYIKAQRCHPGNPIYLLHTNTADAPNQIRWRKVEGKWRATFGLPHYSEKALIETALEKGIPTQ